ncbi:hypothetical protein [Coleofasciculus sp. H7-2]|uniref:hypothetical protein n=1 Tax=Coleofasciculus sp. H7-2 TaxID=3351545 RepID=UPI00366E9BC5
MRWMLCGSPVNQSFDLVEFDMQRAIALWQEGLPVVPVWLDVIHQRLETQLKLWGKCA